MTATLHAVTEAQAPRCICTQRGYCADDPPGCPACIHLRGDAPYLAEQPHDVFAQLDALARRIDDHQARLDALDRL